jgi:hypothetical protein
MIVAVAAEPLQFASGGSGFKWQKSKLAVRAHDGLSGNKGDRSEASRGWRASA